MTTYEKISSTGEAFWQREAKDAQLRLRGKFSGRKSFYGHKIESQAGVIDSLLLEGRFTIEEMAISSKFSSGRVAVSRVRQHLNAKLRDKLNVDIQFDKKNRVFAANNVTSAENNRLVNASEAKAAEAALAGKIRHIAKAKRLAKIDKKRAAGK